MTGSLTAECRGPDGDAVPAAVETTSPSRVRILLTPRDPGEHTFYINYGGIPLPGSPLQGMQFAHAYQKICKGRLVIIVIIVFRSS